jgi:glycosyltransferase involved in cell wall biosynthesis
MEKVKISVLIPVKNEIKNIENCIQNLINWADEVLIVDSNSTDGTIQLLEKYPVKIIQFYYEGGWPKKRQWVLDNYQFRNPWILLLDADEILGESIKEEIRVAIDRKDIDGYWINFEMVFMGKHLRYGGSSVWKLFLFRTGKGRFEKRILNQNINMSDIEVHEHVIVDGKTARLRHPIKHENVNSFFRYIQKHNEYSEWESFLFYHNLNGELKPTLNGNQAQRRRWLKKKFILFPGSPFFYFILNYIFKLGFLDGAQGFYFCVLQGIQIFHIKIKVLEKKMYNRA